MGTSYRLSLITLTVNSKGVETHQFWKS